MTSFPKVDVATTAQLRHFSGKTRVLEEGAIGVCSHLIDCDKRAMTVIDPSIETSHISQQALMFSSDDELLNGSS